jgi:hypothetical protein
MKNFLKKIWKWFLGTMTNYQGPDEVYGIILEREYNRIHSKEQKDGIQK